MAGPSPEAPANMPELDKSSLARPLGWLGLLPLLPTLLLMLGAIHFAVTLRASHEAVMRSSVPAVRLAVEGEVRANLLTLKALARSAHLAAGDLERFHAEARQAVAEKGRTVILRDRTGQQLVNASVPFGVPLPKSAGPFHEAALAAEGPVLSGYISRQRAPILAEDIYSITVPVVVGGQAWFLSFGDSLQRLRAILEAHAAQKEWVAVLGDQQGIIMARSKLHQESAGKPLPPAFIYETARAHPGGVGFWRGVNVDGDAIVTAFTHLDVPELGGKSWIISIGMLHSAFEAPVRWAFLLSLLVIAFMAFFTSWAHNHSADAIMRVFETKQADLREKHHLLELTLREMYHRSRNLLSVLSAMMRIGLKTASSAEEYAKIMIEQVHGISKANDLLINSTQHTTLHKLVETIADGLLATRFRVEEGPDVSLRSVQTVALAMALQELKANAIKHGALADGPGTVAIRWEVAEGHLTLCWTERGGGRVAPPRRKGFGSTLLPALVESQLGGILRLEYGGEGFSCTIRFPL